MMGVLIGHLDFVFLYLNSWLTEMYRFQNDLLVVKAATIQLNLHPQDTKLCSLPCY